MLSNEAVIQTDDNKLVNRNSLEEEDSDDSDIWDDQKHVLEAEFEAFSDTDTETNEQLGDDEISDNEHEAELLDQFDENLSYVSYRRHSSDDILEAVQAVKLNYSFPFQDGRQVLGHQLPGLVSLSCFHINSSVFWMISIFCSAIFISGSAE